jgi:hypothetical protein
MYPAPSEASHSAVSAISRGRVSTHVLEPDGIRLIEAPSRVHQHVNPSVERVGPFNRGLFDDGGLCPVFWVEPERGCCGFC